MNLWPMRANLHYLTVYSTVLNFQQVYDTVEQ